MKLLRFIPIVVLLCTVLFFFKPFLLENRIPIPADTIVGLYHPFRDLYSNQYPRGIPFKNSLITDPVRQQYPWRYLGIELLKQGTVPLWNPYNFSGAPLFANFQSAVLYPLNIIFFVLPFATGWGFLILLQQVLAGVFMYLYLKNLKLSPWASFFGSITWIFSGFCISWLEWGTVVHTALWLPLILLCIDKFFKAQKMYLWSLVLVVSLISSFFAGHLQTFFYLFIVQGIYFLVRWFQNGKRKRILLLYLLVSISYLILLLPQLIPTLQLIGESARNLDQLDNWQKDGWFIPWQNLVQFIAPDFFGNPATLNYFGIWNYAEFVGYIGILPLILALSALVKREKNSGLFAIMFFIALLLAVPNIVSKLPFILNIPFLSTSQPTRLLFVIDFALAVLAAIGFEQIKTKKKILASITILFGFLFAFAWLFILVGIKYFGVSDSEMYTSISKQNLILPTVLYLSSCIAIFLVFFAKKPRVRIAVIIFFFAITLFDLVRFANKFTPFTPSQYLYPQTKTTQFLQKNIGNFRFMAIDKEIMTPNFSIMYHLQDISGYDPLYLLRYGQLIAASERKEPNIDAPLGFNRIIQPANYDSKIIDLLGVKYILSLHDIKSPMLTKVFEEGVTKVFENKNVVPRAFFVERVLQTSYGKNQQKAIEALFNPLYNPKTTAVVEEYPFSSVDLSVGSAYITKYSGNEVVINTSNTGDGLLILTDIWYPTWKARIISKSLNKTYNTPIFLTNYSFRSVMVPAGENTIIFYNTW